MRSTASLAPKSNFHYFVFRSFQPEADPPLRGKQKIAPRSGTRRETVSKVPAKFQVENYLKIKLWVLVRIHKVSRDAQFTFYSQSVVAAGEHEVLLEIPPNESKAILNNNCPGYRIINRSGTNFGHSTVGKDDTLHLLIQEVLN